MQGKKKSSPESEQAYKQLRLASRFTRHEDHETGSEKIAGEGLVPLAVKLSTIMHGTALHLRGDRDA